MLLSGVAMNTSPELRDLKSNEARLREVADAHRRARASTAVRRRPAAQLFRREGLKQTASPLPVWDMLVPFLLALIILDVAVRRIAWDWNSTKQLAAGAATRVRVVHDDAKVETPQTLDALRRRHARRSPSSKFRTGEAAATARRGAAAGGRRRVPTPRRSSKPDGKARRGRHHARSSAAPPNKPIPPPPKKIEPKGMPGGAGEHLGGLMEAKRRAQQQIKEKEQGE